MTSRARTTTPTCMSRRRYRCSPIGPAYARSRRSSGYRYSEYASAGGADAYKAELMYRPVDALRVRSSYQHAVRAPSVYELYLPQLTEFLFSPDLEPLDPCEADSAERNGPDQAQVEALCLAQGFPPELLPDYDDNFDVARGFAGGNPDLDPETADTLTVGVVLTSPFASRWLDRLQVSVDWYRIEIDDAIVTVSADEFIARCFDPAFNPAFELSNRWCGMFSRNPASGDIVDAYEILRNSEGLRTSGLDLQLDWRFDLGPGELGLNWLVSYVNSFERLEASGVPATGAGRDCAGATSSAFAAGMEMELRRDLCVAGTDLDARWRYIDGMKDAEHDDRTRVPNPALRLFRFRRVL